MTTHENEPAFTGTTSIPDGTQKKQIPIVRWVRIVIFLATALSGIATCLALFRYQHSAALCARMEKPIAHYKETLAALAPFISDKARQESEAQEQPYLTIYAVAAAQENVYRSLTFCDAGILAICFLLLFFNGWRSPSIVCAAFSIFGFTALFILIYLARFKAAGGWATLSDEKTSWMPYVFVFQVGLLFTGAAGVWAGMKWRAVKRECGTNSA